MRERFYNLFWEDRSARLKIYVSAVMCSLLIGAVMKANGISEEELTSNVIGICLLWLCFWTIVYCAFPHKQHAAETQPHVTRRFALAGVVTAVAITVSGSLEKVEAAIVNRRLKQFKEDDTVNPSALEKLTNALDYSQKNRLPINPTLVSRVGQILSERSPAPYSEAVHDALEDVANAQSRIRSPGEAETKSPSHFMTLPGVSFINSVFTSQDIRLDGITADNCAFYDCVLIYEGGPISLLDCVFNRCRFQISHTPTGDRLLSKLAESNQVTLIG